MSPICSKFNNNGGFALRINTCHLPDFNFLKYAILSPNCVPTAFRTIYILRKEELLLKHLIDSA